MVLLAMRSGRAATATLLTAALARALAVHLALGLLQLLGLQLTRMRPQLR